MRIRNRDKSLWQPKGGELEVLPMLVDIDELRGPFIEGGSSRPAPDSEAQRAMSSIALKMIVGINPTEKDIAKLEAALGQPANL